MDAASEFESFDKDIKDEDLVDGPEGYEDDDPNGDDDDANADEDEDDSDIYSVFGLVEQPLGSGRMHATDTNAFVGILHRIDGGRSVKATCIVCESLYVCVMS